MKLSGNTILVTGGASGIGLALVERFHAAGNTVIVCGRRADVLAEAKAKLPGLHTMVADVGQAADRVRLAEEVTRDFPALNVLINNAGIQRRGTVTEGAEAWADHQTEIAINFEAPIHLTMLVMPHLRTQANAAVINVTSGLSFAPLPMAAIYSATKAAMHSYTLSLRVQAKKLGVEVIEMVPPAVQTDLGGVGLHTFGVPLDEFADAMWQGLEAGREEMGYGTSETRRHASRAELDAALASLSALSL